MGSGGGGGLMGMFAGEVRSGSEFSAVKRSLLRANLKICGASAPLSAYPLNVNFCWRSLQVLDDAADHLMRTFAPYRVLAMHPHRILLSALAFAPLLLSGALSGCGKADPAPNSPNLQTSPAAQSSKAAATATTLAKAAVERLPFSSYLPVEPHRPNVDASPETHDIVTVFHALKGGAPTPLSEVVEDRIGEYWLRHENAFEAQRKRQEAETLVQGELERVNGRRHYFAEFDTYVRGKAGKGDIAVGKLASPFDIKTKSFRLSGCIHGISDYHEKVSIVQSISIAKTDCQVRIDDLAVAEAFEQSRVSGASGAFAAKAVQYFRVLDASVTKEKSKRLEIAVDRVDYYYLLNGSIFVVSWEGSDQPLTLKAVTNPQDYEALVRWPFAPQLLRS